MTVYFNNIDVYNSIAAGIITYLSDNDAVFVLPNVNIIQTNAGFGVVMDGSGIRTHVQGTVIGDRFAIADVAPDSTGNSVFVAATGYVASVTTGAMLLVSQDVEVVNQGTIHGGIGEGAAAIGVSFGSRNAKLWNSGSIVSNDIAVRAIAAGAMIENFGTITGVGGVGISLLDADSTLSNHGAISGRTGIFLSAANNQLSNGPTGRITGVGASPQPSAGIDARGPTIEIINLGLIEGIGKVALRLEAEATGAIGDITSVTTLANAGIIASSIGVAVQAVSLVGREAELNLTNTGTITGDILLVGGNDSYDGDGGRLDGTLFAGAGADSLTGGDARDRLRGEAGADSIEGGGNRDSLDGGSEDDTIEGGDGADHLAGGLGLDTLVYANSGAGVIIDLDTGEASGGEATGDTISGFERILGSHFNDELSGAATSDALDGAAGNDLLEGAGGADQLNGRRGADTQIGGTGADTLSGGRGADLFLYLGLGDTGTSNTGRDRITDFNAREGDRISLEAIDANDTAPGDQAFVFIGTAAFTTAGQLRYVSGTTTVIEGNVSTGDVTADFRIALNGNIVLSGSDFLL